MMGKGSLLTHAGLFLTMAKRSCRQWFAALPKIGLIVVMLAAGLVHAPQTVSADTVVMEKGLSNAVVMTVNPVTNKIYVATTATAGLPPYELKIIDAATNSLRTLTLQDKPSDIAINPVTNKIYVVSAIGHNATVINGETDEMNTIETGYNPRGVAVNPVTNKIYVLNQYEKSVTIINGDTNGTSTVNLAGYQGLNGVAVNPATNKIYVLCSTKTESDDVVVIDGATGVKSKTVSVGAYAKSIAVDTAANLIYVANYYGKSVSVIDGFNDNVSSTIDLGPAAEQLNSIAVNPITHKIYVVGDSSKLLWVIDGMTNKVEAVKSVQSGTQRVAVNPSTNKIYLTSLYSVTVIDGEDNSMSTLTAGNEDSINLFINPVTDKIYVTSFVNKKLMVIDGMRTSSSTIGTGSYPRSIAINPFTNKAYVANENSHDVTVIDLNMKELKIVKTLKVENGPKEIAVNPLTNRIYVIHTASPATVIDGENDTIIAQVPVGSSPTAVAVNPITNQVYISNNGSNNVTVIDGATNRTSTVAVGSGPYHVAVNQLTNKVYVANFNDGTVSIIDGATKKVTDSVPVGTRPRMVAINENTNRIYVANSGSNDVTIIDGNSNATSTVPADTQPYAVAVNSKSNKTYVVNFQSNNVTVIDEASSSSNPSITQVPISEWGLQKIAVDEGNDKIYIATMNALMMIDGATNTSTILKGGINATDVAVNQATNKVYAVNSGYNEVVAINQKWNANPLPISITPFPNNRLTDGAATVRFNPTNKYEPIKGSITNLYYQLDSMQGTWNKAALVFSFPNMYYEGTFDSLTPGMHVLYSFANAGQQTIGESGIGGGYAFYVAPKAATPKATPTSHEVIEGTQVELTTTTDEASIYYTTDGRKPSPSSGTRYSGPISVSRNMTIKAIAVKAGMTDSDVMTEIYTLPVTAPSLPSVPENLTSASGDQNVTLTWNTVANADSYMVYKYEGTSAPTSTDDWVLAQENVTGNTFTVTGLVNGTSYAFAVKAVNTKGVSDLSNAVIATPVDSPTPTVPSSPTHVVAEAGDGQAKVSFDVPENDGGSPILIYTVTAWENGTPTTITKSGNTSPIIITGLTNGTTYTFTVVAMNAKGSSIQSAPSNPVTPKAKQHDPDTEAPRWPEGSELTVSDITQTSVKLSWPSATDNVGVTGYRIYVNGTEHEPVGGSVNGTTIAGLTANTTYSFKVTAYDEAGNESDALTGSAKTIPQPTEPDTEAPQWPDGSELTVSDITQTSVKLTWPSATDNVGVTGYRIYVDDKERTTVSGDVYAITVNALTADTNYTFKVTAFDSEGNESVALTASAKTLPQPTEPDTEAPQWPDGSELTVSDITQTSVKLSWPSATDNVGVTGYRIYVNGAEHGTVDSGVNGIMINGLTANTSYTFKVTAYDAVGNESAALSASAKTLPQPTEPDTEAPRWSDGSELTVSDITQTSVKLSWPSATDNVGVTGYRIYVDDVEYKTVGENENALIVNGLMAETSYTFKVKSYDEAGNESTALSASAKTLPQPTEPDTEAPHWPGGSELTVSDITQTSVKLTWPSATDNVKVTGYRIYVDDKERTTVSGDVYAITVNALTADTNYTFKVTAFDAEGNESAALTASATTLPQPSEPDTEAPQWPDDSELMVSDVTQTSVKLTWPSATDNVAVIAYRIYVNGTEREKVAGNVHAITIDGLTANTSYTFKVTAYDAAGNVSDALTASANTMPQPTESDTEAPKWPDGSKLTVSDITQTSMKLSWPIATDNVGVAGYRIYVDGKERTTVSGNVYLTTITGLTANTNYTLRVTAFDAEGNESAALTASAKTLPQPSKPDTEAPQWPSGSQLTVSGITKNSVKLSWPTATDNVGVTGYRIYVDDKERMTVSGNVYATTVDSLSGNTTYMFKVTAYDAEGNESAPLSKQVTTARSSSGGGGSGGSGSAGGRALSSNADLEELRVWDKDKKLELSTSFAAGTTSYTARTQAEQVEIAVKPAHSAAKVILKEKVITDRTKVLLEEGDNKLVLIVQAENGSKKEYTLNIRRETPKSSEPAIHFTDIAGHWAESDIKRAAAKGIVSGYPDGTFKPNHPVTRAEFTVMLTGALQLEEQGATVTFTDNDQIGKWAKQAVAQAVQTEMINGYEDGSFRPNAHITRAEMAVMIARALKLPLKANSVTVFADDEAIPQWAKSSVEAIRAIGISSGREGSKFVPSETATRAEAAVMLLRMLEKKEE